MTEHIVELLDTEIARLQNLKNLLSGLSDQPVKRGPGRPKKTATAEAPPRKRVLSADARARIAAAQKKRWAAAKKG